ncbi:MAG: hypothetical protein GY754_39095 [bacterium]|nr:hypothetical protein [bacterium]
MIVFLWMFQTLLSVYLIVSGVLRITGRAEETGDSIWKKWIIIKPKGSKKLAGVFEIFLGLLLIVPFATGYLQFFTYGAALVVAITMFFVSIISIRKNGIKRTLLPVFILLASFFLCVGHYKIAKIPTVYFMKNSLKWRAIEMSWQAHYNAAAPREGDGALDFELFDPAGKKKFRLSDYTGKKPVALIFGSFT